ncbi:hypothetical protein WA026_015785 [Henosepilachna vigintioctopunctata]|uniref:Zinc finger PHD-type domain-containing protein n=1 Tax=Henosepilachna vigintioctopunctata TaxID=420089 RepID=A0AAW1V320_9CUCU
MASLFKVSSVNKMDKKKIVKATSIDALAARAKAKLKLGELKYKTGSIDGEVQSLQQIIYSAVRYQRKSQAGAGCKLFHILIYDNDDEVVEKPRMQDEYGYVANLPASPLPDEKNNKPGPSNASQQKMKNKPGSSTVTSQKRKQYSAKINKSASVKSKVSKQEGKGHSKKSKNGWYCYVCEEDRIADMRLCFLCLTYVHEECVGLTKEDTDKFVCSRCSPD